MATFEKRSGAWRARVRKGGTDRTETFRTKAEAQAWATQLEADLANERRGEIPEHKTFGDLLERYAAEVAPTKRGGDKELLRIAATQQRDIAKVKLLDLDERDLRIGRFVFACNGDTPFVKRLEDDAVVLSWSEAPKLIATNDSAIDTATLQAIANAAIKRLTQRIPSTSSVFR